MHRHIWKIASTAACDSPLDKMVAAGLTKLDARSDAIAREWATAPVIVTARCEKCGTEKVYRA